MLLLLAVVLFASCSNDDDTNLPTNDSVTIKDLLTDVGFNGFAIVTKNGEDLVRQGFGLANVNTEMPQDYNLAYRIASVSKTLTAAAIVQLKRDGLITNFNQTLSEFDDDFPKGNQITIAHLLSHQSGIPDYFFLAKEANEQGETLNLEAIYDLITDLISENNLDFTPGASKAYSNSNYFLAGLLIQELSGMSYHNYIKQKILNPLEMNNTFRGLDNIDTDTHAQGYKNEMPNSNYSMVNAFGAGDYSSSPENMEIWVNAVKNNWFTEAEKSKIFAQDVPSGYVDFGLGWFTSQEGNSTMFWHGGDINGYWSIIGFIPENNTTVVLLSNQESDNEATQRSAVIQYLLTNSQY
ncbi:serine hydrolase domain-containing protein [Postechiella marina]|uniref:Serine hydrolase domain-containing protein n=2 Tax=Postechiella marina TaxID=943941 RepID=A0ABP8C1X2_9FLAO